MNSCTEGWDAMVLDNTPKSTHIEDCVFWYRAKPKRDFKIGSPELWTFNNKNINNDTKKKKKESTIISKNPVKVNKISKK